MSETIHPLLLALEKQWSPRLDSARSIITLLCDSTLTDDEIESLLEGLLQAFKDVRNEPEWPPVSANR